MQRVDLALVGEQLHDDDGAGKGERHSGIECCERLETKRSAQPVAEQRAERHLPEASSEYEWTQRSDEAEVELQPHHEQEQGDPDLGQQVDLVRGRDPAKDRRTLEDAHDDEGENQGLAQPECESA